MAHRRLGVRELSLARFSHLVLVLALLFTAAVPAASQTSAFPRLLADSDDILRAKDWMAKHAWYRNLIEARKREADDFIRHRPIFVSPIKQTYEYKMYSCPKHDVALLYEENRPYEHRCSVDTTESFSGGKYDAAWAGWYNRVVASRLVWLGILYQIYGDERYAEAGREILMTFADLYLKYPTSNTILGPAHVFFGTLSESFWGVDMAYGYDLLYNYKGFSESDRKVLKEKFFYPLAHITQQFPESASNRQLWYNNVSAAVGFLYNDQELIDFALKGKYGFYWQLGSATPESGFWAEWSGYHFVALRGMIHLAEMARHNGIDLYRVEIAGRSMKKMFDAPFELILPNYEFPRSKDSGGGNILEYAVYYEVGYAVYRDPKYLALLNKTSVMRGTQIVGETSALGEDKAPVTMFNLSPELPQLTQNFIPEHSVNMEGNGFAVLRNGSGTDRRYLYLDYGIMGGEHGHPDRMQIGYYANGRNWIVDPLNESYFNPNLQLWYRQSIAHVTPVLDQTSQTWTNGYGRFFGALPSFQVASGATKTAYPGSEITRTLVQIGDYFLDVVDVEGPDRRTIDWPLQSFGNLTLEGVELSDEPRDLFGHEPGYPGYDQLRNIRSDREAGNWSAVFRDGDGGLMVRAIDEPGTTVFQATAPSIGGFYKQMVLEAKPMQMVISRRVSDTTKFVHLLHAYRDSPSVKSVSKGKRADEYVVSHGGGTDIVRIGVKSSEYQLVRTSGSVVAVAASFNSKEVRSGNQLLMQSSSVLEGFEARWEGEKLFVTIQGPYTDLKLFAPGVTSVELNGTLVTVEREGDFVVVRETKGITLEILSPGDSLMFVGLPNRISARITNPSTTPVRGSLSLQLSSDWKERVESQLEWWGGVVNLLPLNKGSVRRTIEPAGYRDDAGWIHGVASPAVEIPAKGSRIVELNVNIPNDAPPVVYPSSLHFAGVSVAQSFTAVHPVTADIRMPNGKTAQLEITLTNHMSKTNPVSLQVHPHPSWKAKGTLTRTVSLKPLEKKSITIPVQLGVYSPENQFYPIQCSLKSGGFSVRTERDLYVGIAHYARIAPSLDGSWNGWNRSNPMTIDRSTQIHKLLLGNQPWGGLADLSAKIHVMYDDRYLYVGADVSDQTNITTWNFPAMSYPWDTDCMEVVLDTRLGADQGYDPPTPGLFRHLSLAEYRKTEFPQELWRGGGAGGPTLPKPLLVQNAETFYKKTDSGYILISRYPLASLPNGIVKPGNKIGFDVAVNDNDGTTYRKNVHIWAGFTSNQTWWDLGSIGALIFGPR